MAENTFRSPNFYEREIDLTGPVVGNPVGTPAGIIGTANKGPAFIPVTVSNFGEFKLTFGDLDATKMGPYAAAEWLKYRTALTYLRVLGAGANVTSAQIAATDTTGRVASAGFKIVPAVAVDDSYGRHNGSVQFIAARHLKQTDEVIGYPVLTQNSSFPGVSSVNLIRGVVFLPTTSRLMILDGEESTTGKFVAAGPDDVGTVVNDKVKLVISSTLGSTFYSQDAIPGIKTFNVSMDPTSSDYFGKVLNSDPTKFVEAQHYLYTDFAVDAEVATATSVAVLSGSNSTSSTSGELSTKFINAFGSYDTRFKTPKTSWFISQPFGTTEYNLFKIEALDDGEYANNLYKISITNLKMSEDESFPYGSFTLSVRKFNDNDLNPVVLEQFNGCNLDPTSENYVAKKVGDVKAYYNFDATIDTERRIVKSGKYANQSQYVRIIMSDAVENALVPQKSIPFGFRGPEVLKTNDALTDVPGTSVRLSGKMTTGIESSLTGSLVPPVPFRFKITRGQTNSSPTFSGQSSNSELVNSAYHWGVKFERSNLVLNANVSSEINPLLTSLTKFQGIKELDTVTTGSALDVLGNNKFTLARVALANGAIADLTSSLSTHMKDACYLRNAKQDTTKYTITDPTSAAARISFGTLVAETSSLTFNRFQQYMKFTNFMQGGFDGLNILDGNSNAMNDVSVSFDTGGAAEAAYVPAGFATQQNGLGTSNANVVSYKTAIDIMTDPMISAVNVLSIPGIDESYITDYASVKTKEYGMAIYVLDIPGYSDTAARLYLNSATRPSVDKTAQIFAARAIDNNYVATYWPPVYINDDSNKRRVLVPASVAINSAYAYNDKVSYPWYAPAGFNRASLDFVKNVQVRLNSSDRDTLQDQRINPIATFPKFGYVVYGQRTMQMAKSSLDRVNVRRLLLEVKRVIIDIAKVMTFENNTPAVRAQFVANSNLQLALIQANSGIEKFKVIMDESNNTAADNEANRVNGRIVVVPTRTIENIAIDFIITNSGVQFV